MKTNQLGVPVAVILCSLFGYAAGTGWIRIGPPGRDATELTTKELEPTQPSIEPLNIPSRNVRNRKQDRAVARTGLSMATLPVALTELSETPQAKSADPPSPAPATETNKPDAPKPNPPSPAPADPSKPDAPKPNPPSPVAADPGKTAAAASTPNTTVPPPPLPALRTPVIRVRVKDEIPAVDVGEGVESDGPALTLVVSDEPIPPTKLESDVKLSLSASKISLRGFVQPEIDNSAQPPTVTFREVGSYSLTLRKSRTGTDGDSKPIEESRTITIRSKTRSPIPAIVQMIEKVPKQGGTAGETSDSNPIKDFFTPIDLVGEGSMVLTASIGGGKIQRDLGVLNRSTDSLVTTDTAKADNAGAFPVVRSIAFNLEKTSLIDRPTQLAVIDLWTLESSVAPFPTVMINSTRDKQGGSIGPAPTGPNVEFPEYTPPRSYPDGFNPSDKVETRVSRLYYFRDAHRVAQIINREARSYNYVAVATARRQAEDARDAADNATDLRRSREIKAVRAAQASRGAEKELKQAQAELAESKRIDAENAAQIKEVNQDIANNSKDLAAADEALKTANADLAAAKQKMPIDQPTIDKAAQQVAELTIKKSDLTKVDSDLKSQLDELNKAVAASNTSNLQTSVSQAGTKLENARSSETSESDQEVREQQVEDRARENQFRQQVAAAHEDPDTYAPGKIGSLDPVRQVSVSVIGEGEIQLRGPIKGINIIRTMINQIDAPVGQVRIGVHTVQINGEHGNRMEKVAGRIQDYIDHSRFLTSQSGQMLRNAVVGVASRKAMATQAEAEAELAQAAALCTDPAEQQAMLRDGLRKQATRDRKYVRAFFGDDFIDELEDIDSEFLHSGNKLLSLHSMDTTSLASALFLLALAKNDTRMEILNDFQAMLATDLPLAEANYFSAGAGTRGKDHFHKFKMLAGNAKFQSLLGFFNAQVEGGNTLNPLQREFIRLAQIFKSRLVTELELNQRVKERGLIEQRIGDYLETLRKQDRRQKSAEEAFQTAQADISTSLRRVAASTEQVEALVTRLGKSQNQIDSLLSELIDNIRIENIVKVSEHLFDESLIDPVYFKEILPEELKQLGSGWNLSSEKAEVRITKTFRVGSNKVEARIAQPGLVIRSSALQAILDLSSQFDAIVDNLEINSANLSRFASLSLEEKSTLAAKIHQLKLNWEQFKAKNQDPKIGTGSDTQYGVTLDYGILQLLQDIKRTANRAQKSVSNELGPWRTVLEKSFEKLTQTDLVTEDPEVALRVVSRMIEAINAIKGSSEDDTSPLSISLKEAEAGLRSFIEQLIKMQFARRNFEASRRPLDHKKLLDMLIDDVEDKYIELLEGTRSHTANIDAYIKTVATALDDDFNTQYYYPTFAEVRRASRYWDVNFSQIETTNVLANNRGFAKVEPQATMEFDLPKRDILINEAMNGALAMTKDFGALVNDPSFLAMAKLRSGQPTSSLAPGASGGVNTVRNVMPGLPRSDDEKLFSQQGAGRTQFGAGMEALIPDPAVYKFETGTGFEIRPVIQPDGQSVVFHFNYMYTSNIREPVRPDEKHLGRVKRHFIDTDVQLGNYELREVSRYQVALKASRTSRGIPLFEDIPGLGMLFRPLPSAEASLQQNIVLAQGTVFPTLFDLMGLRWAPAVADLDTLRLKNDNFVVRSRARDVANRVFDISSARVDEFLRIPPAERRADLYRTQQTIPDIHPDGYRGGGLNYRDSHLREGYDPTETVPESQFIPADSRGVPGEQPMQGPASETYLAPGPLEGARTRSSEDLGLAARTGPRDRTITRSPDTASARDPRFTRRPNAAPRPDFKTPVSSPTSRNQPSRVPQLEGPTSSLGSKVSRSRLTNQDPALIRAASPPPPRGLPPLPTASPLPRPTTNPKRSTETTPNPPTAPVAKPPRKSLLSRLRGDQS